MEVRILQMVILNLMNGIGLAKQENVKVQGYHKETVLRKRVGVVDLKRW
jgi:hypothetical protein